MPPHNPVGMKTVTVRIYTIIAFAMNFIRLPFAKFHALHFSLVFTLQLMPKHGAFENSGQRRIAALHLLFRFFN